MRQQTTFPRKVSPASAIVTSPPSARPRNLSCDLNLRPHPRPDSLLHERLARVLQHAQSNHHIDRESTGKSPGCRVEINNQLKLLAVIRHWRLPPDPPQAPARPECSSTPPGYRALGGTRRTR